MRLAFAPLVLFTLVACGDEGGSVDAGATDAGRVDAATDASVDASTDASIDATIDDDAGLDADVDAAADAGPESVWSPAPGTTWYWQLTGELASHEVAVYDVDLFDTSASTIASLQSEGRRVICYFSAGSYEEWRDDASDFPTAALGNELDGWAGERWLDVRAEGVLQVMGARLDLARTKGCDAVEPDNVDGYDNGSGFPLTAADQLTYNRWLASEAHSRGLSIGLKNDLAQVDELVADFDWALNEECLAFDECDLYGPFISAGKAVFHAEYADPGELSAVCAATAPLGLSTAIAALDLDGSRWLPCW